MKIQVAVFFGGKSVEHEVSVISAMQAIAALDRSKYDTIPVYLPKEGGMYTGPGFDRVESYKNIPALLEGGRQVSLARQDSKVVLLSSVKKLFGTEQQATCVDVALPVLHGTFGEDGSLQGMLEIMGLPYAGCDVLSSAMCMDKASAKMALRAADLPVLDDLVLDAYHYEQSPETVLSALETHYPYPVIVKPANLGSSIGISKADSREKLSAALDLAFRFSQRVIIEPALIHLREINCSVLGDSRKARASVCEEPVAQDEILSYKDKYQSGGKSGKSEGMSSLSRVIPADLPTEKSISVRKLAVKAFQALDCSGVVRIDFLWDTLHDVFYINELNTIPGSLAFYLWEATDLTFPALLDELIELAFARSRARAQLLFTHDSNILATADLRGSKA